MRRNQGNLVPVKPDSLGTLHIFIRLLPSTRTGAHTAADGVRLATRAMLLLAAYCRESGAPAEANYALMRAHFQVS